MSDQTQAMDFGLLNEAANAAEERRGPSVYFGKIDFAAVYKQFHGKGVAPDTVTPAVWKTLPKDEQGMEVHISMDVSELNPNLTFPYTRRLTLGDADWHKTWRKSVETVMGAGTMSKGAYGDTMAKIAGKYVQVEDVPQIKDPAYSTPRLVAVYGSREECLAAHNARFAGGSSGSNGASASSADTPPGYQATAWEQTKPHIKAELDKGTPPAQIASDYGIPVSFVVALK